MEQRPLRLGDIVDDYCPRERRITNHVIVALMDDRVQQTRCSTCESEHAYKEARVPKRRKKDEAGVLVVPGSPPAVSDQPVVDDAQAPVLARGATVDHQVDEPVPVSSEAPDPEPNGTGEEAWFGHRRLIRASLPKTDAEPLPRPIPEFTMHQRQPSGRQHFRPGFGGDGSGYNGFRHGRPGGGQGQGNGGQNRGQGGGRPNRGGRGRHRGGNGGGKPPR